MRGLKFVVALVGVLLLHLVAVRLVPSFPRYLDLFLVLTVLNALNGNSLTGLVGGLVAGLVADSLSGSLYGLHSFAGTLVGYGTARVAQQFFVQHLAVVGLFVSLAAAFQQIVLLGLRLFLLADPEIPSLGGLALKSLGCGIVAIGLLLLNQQVTGRVRSWQWRRGSRFQLERGT